MNIDQMLDTALERLQEGNPQRAVDLLKTILNASPDDAEAWSLLGLAEQAIGRSESALNALKHSLTIDPLSADTEYNLGEVLTRVGQRSEAIDHFDRCVELDPEYGLAWRRLAQLRVQNGDDAGAIEALQRMANFSPMEAGILLQIGQLQMKLLQWQAAKETLNRAAVLNPNGLPIHVLLYRVAAMLGLHEEAIAASDRAIEIDPEHKKIRLDRADVLAQLHLPLKAVEAATDYVRRYPEDPAGHRKLGALFMQQREYGAAARAAAAIIEHAPEDAQAFAMLGEVLVQMGRAADAIPQLERALELNPDLLAARMYYGIALDHVYERTKAIDQVREVVEVEPDDMEALGYLGQLLFRSGKYADAGECFDRVLGKIPDDAVGLTGLAMLAGAQAKPEKAWELYERAIVARSDDPIIIGTALMAANANPKLSKSRVYELHLEWATRQCRRLAHPPHDSWENTLDPKRRLRIGYLSADLRSHSVSYFLEPLIAAHNRTQVELIAFDNTRTPDNISTHLRQFFTEWHRVIGISDQRLSELIRERCVDILVDLNGHTADHRMSVMALRPAPVQVTYLGYPNTTGLTEVDYRLTDAVADPPGPADQFVTERLLRLPHGFLCFNPPQPHLPISELSSADGEPLRFAAFNAIHKINDDVVRTWSQILKAIPNSQLLIKANGLADPKTQQSMAEKFAAEQIDADRVIFLPRSPAQTDHLAVYNRCDIALDTFPYNGTTTTCEAMWMGVPVVTLVGDRHASRVGLSLLTQMDLTELAADSVDSFVEIAVRLANDRPRLAELRRTMRERMLKSPLMDGKGFANDVEAAYRQMWRTWCENQPSVV